MVETGINEVETCVASCQKTVMQYVTTRQIMDLCLATVQRPGEWVYQRWWEQEGIDIEGIWEAVLVAEAEKEWGRGGLGEETKGEMEN